MNDNALTASIKLTIVADKICDATRYAFGAGVNEVFWARTALERIGDAKILLAEAEALLKQEVQVPE